MSFRVQRIWVPLTNLMISVAQDDLGGQARQKSVWHISVCVKWTFWQPSVHVKAGQAKWLTESNVSESIVFVVPESRLARNVLDLSSGMAKVSPNHCVRSV